MEFIIAVGFAALYIRLGEVRDAYKRHTNTVDGTLSRINENLYGIRNILRKEDDFEFELTLDDNDKN